MVCVDRVLAFCQHARILLVIFFYIFLYVNVTYGATFRKIEKEFFIWGRIFIVGKLA